jgi:hypothetical protein
MRKFLLRYCMREQDLELKLIEGEYRSTEQPDAC